MSKLKVAICLPCFSNPENIEGCIESILKSNSNTYDLEILMFNNSERQDIIETCKELAYLHQEIRLIDYRTNRGCSVCLLYTSPSPRDRQKSRMPSSA